MKTDQLTTPLVEYQVEELIVIALFSNMLHEGRWIENGEMLYDCLNQRLKLDQSKIRDLLHIYGTQPSSAKGSLAFKSELQNIIDRSVHKSKVARLLAPLIKATGWNLNFETDEIAKIGSIRTDSEVNSKPPPESIQANEPVCGSKIRLPTKFKTAQRINEQMHALRNSRPEVKLFHLFFILGWQRDLTRLSISVGLAIACITQGILLWPVEWRVFMAPTSIQPGFVKNLKKSSILSPLHEVGLEFSVGNDVIRSKCYVPLSYRIKIDQNVQIEYLMDNPGYARIVGCYHHCIDPFVIYTIIVFLVISYLTKASIIRALNYMRILSVGQPRLAQVVSHEALGDIDRITAITRRLPIRQSQARLVQLEYEHFATTVSLQIVAYNLSESVNEKYKVILVDPDNTKFGLIIDDLSDYLSLNSDGEFQLSSWVQYDRLISQLGYIPIAWFLFGYGIDSFFALITNTLNTMRENLLKL